MCNLLVGCLLGNMRDQAAIGFAEFALVSVQLSEYQSKQAGFTRAIGASDTYFLSGMDVEMGIAEKQVSTTADTEMVELEHGTASS
ncbi:hypothetical protein A3194_12755 [Candidatus Thiodiazotropha endoloripes]|nr:hypothetical protein A3194_12755 [Candidatus Thiodiazotropha endoloripes]